MVVRDHTFLIFFFFLRVFEPYHRLSEALSNNVLRILQGLDCRT